MANSPRVPPTRRAEIVALAALVDVAPEDIDTEDGQDCAKCRGPMALDHELDPSPICWPCADEIAHEFAREVPALLADLEDAERERDELREDQRENKAYGASEYAGDVLAELDRLGAPAARRDLHGVIEDVSYRLQALATQRDEARAVAKGARKEALEEAHERLSGFDCGRRSDDWTDGFDAAVDIVHAMKEPK